MTLLETNSRRCANLMTETYLNPVYRHASPDPFVLKYCGAYWCYFTGMQPDGRAFGILHSQDLVHWEYAASALDPLPDLGPHYWAPEVTYRDGVFYLYYAAGDEETMQMRVATAAHPGGPFVDAGRRLTQEKFAIDGHVFIDNGDRWYFFYAADFLDVERVGTGTVMDAMLDPLTLVGNPRPVTRARFDWQIYDPQRKEKGGLRWHTLEGPFVLKHADRYYQMFSGGNWQNASYGVAYGITDRLDQPGEWLQPCDGVQVPLVIQSDPGRGIIGPGHNSVVRGLDNRELFCVYHRWQPSTSERVLAIDRMDWDEGRLVVHGPSSTPQPVPARPAVSGLDRFEVTGGDFRPASQEVVLVPAEGQTARASLPLAEDRFVLEVSLRFVSAPRQDQAAGLLVEAGSTNVRLRLDHEAVRIEVGDQIETRRLPAGFAPEAFHLIHLEAGAEATLLCIDERRMTWRLPALQGVRRIELQGEGGPSAFAGLAVSY